MEGLRKARVEAEKTMVMVGEVVGLRRLKEHPIQLLPFLLLLLLRQPV